MTRVNQAIISCRDLRNEGVNNFDEIELFVIHPGPIIVPIASHLRESYLDENKLVRKTT